MSGLAFGTAATGGLLLRAGGGVLKAIGGIDWAKIWWVVPLGAAIALALVERREAGRERRLDARDAAGWAAETRAHAVTKASLAGALAQIADNNRRISAAAAELASETRQAAADQASADARWRVTRTSIEALDADGRDPKRGPCTVSAEANKALAGL